MAMRGSARYNWAHLTHEDVANNSKQLQNCAASTWPRHIELATDSNRAVAHETLELRQMYE